MITAETISEALGGKPYGDGFLCLCPAHEDHDPSLSVCDKDGKILVKCFAGCDNPRVIEKLKEMNLWPSGNGNGNGFHVQTLKPQIVATYDYHGPDGNLFFQVVRREPGKDGKKKDFQQRRPDGTGGWIWNLKGVLRVPYRLPELIQAESIAICEGEKDVDNLAALGVTATTCPGGAGKWRPEFRQFFQGKKIAIFADNDVPGHDHAQQVAQNLFNVAAAVKIVELPGLPEKGDVSDWLAAGGSFEELSNLVKAAPAWEPKPPDQPQPNDSDHTACPDHISELNQKHAVVMLGGKCLILNEVIDPTFNRPDITFSSVPDFKNYYANRPIEIPTEKGSTFEPLGKIWLVSSLRRQFEGIVFAPGQDIPGFYNLYRGLAVKPSNGDWSLMRKHILEIIAGGNQEYFRYLLNWMARLVQDPGGERAGVSIALRGEMGTGKGCYVSQFGEIFGSHFLHITNPVHLTHRFNNHLKDCLLCFVDEGIWAGDKTAEGVLKGMITERHIMVEPKGKDAFAVKNHLHLIIASNSEWIVPAGFEERRFLVLDVSNKHKQDHEYFAAIFLQMDHGGREAMLYDLLEMKIDVDLRKIPRTEALLDQVVYSMPTVHKFWLERLRTGTLIDEHRDWEPFVITEKLYAAYLEFSANCGDRYRLIDRQFGKELRRLCPGIRRGQKVIDTRDKWVLFVPDLQTCRENFENAVKGKVNWDDEREIPF